MSWWGSNSTDEIIEKATSELLPGGQEDLALNLHISDQIRSKALNAKDAMHSLKKKLGHKNPNVQLATISLTDTCVKNGGDVFVKEIASREFMDELVFILRAPAGCNIDVKDKILTVIQTWGLASKDKPALGGMYDTYARLKAEGAQFPPIRENIAGSLLETSAAPEWSDSDVCDRCRTQFTLTNRKHHCRSCGGTFCQQCSSKTMPLPRLGIDESVRVCDGCHIKLKLAKAGVSSVTPTEQRSTSLNSTSNISTPARPAADVNEFDDDIKKAIELSLKEAEQQKNSYGGGYVAQQPRQESPKPQENVMEDDPDLVAAIAASLHDMEISRHQPAPQRPVENKNDLSPVEMENILLFSTLMDRVYASGGDVSNDTQINQLYTQIGALQPKLVRSLDETIRKRNRFIETHEKLNMVVRAYDRLLEQRIAASGHSVMPEQNYQPQPLYHQSAYSNSPHYQQQTNDPYHNYYSAPPVQDNGAYYPPVSNQTYPGPPHQQQQQPGAPLESTAPAVIEHHNQVDEAPLIDL